MKTAVVVLAAGRGVRMRSALPKVLHPAAGRPLLDRVLDLARSVADEAIVVVGAGRELLEAHLAGRSDVRIAVQDPPLGTGDALRKALPLLGGSDRVLVLSGDVPLLRPASLRRLLEALDAGYDGAFLTAELDEPGAYGRVVRDASGAVQAIVEAKDASGEVRARREVNAGVYAFRARLLAGTLPLLTPQNAQGEYYLTDVVGLGLAAGGRVEGLVLEDAHEMLGVNSRADLALVDGVLRRRAAEAAMAQGATLLRPETITLDDTVRLAPDVVLEPFVTLRGRTSVGEGTVIGQGCVVADAGIGARVTVRPYCVIESARVGDGSIVGPFARLREGTELAEGVHVGNFVETKKARLEKGVKANHLTYLGDATVGERTNVGAGVITCNYDGFFKHTTTIGADVFVGSDVQLVAPVTVGDRAIIGAGTTVTEDVPDDALAVSRVPQKSLAGAAARIRARKAAEKAGKGKEKKTEA